MRSPSIHVLVLVLSLAPGAACTCSNTGSLASPDGAGTSAGDGALADGGAGGDGGLPFEPDGALVRGVGPGSWLSAADGGDAGPTAPFADGVQVDPSGNLILASGSTDTHHAWLANPSGNGTVSKIDTFTGKEVGRYLAVVPVDGRGNPNGLRYDRTHSPSRTAVDLFGDVWVANRAFGTRGSVTKIAASRLACIDRNQNGRIDTSEDADQNGVISASEMITPAAGRETDPTAYDECVLFSTPLGTAAQPTVPRALAIEDSFEGTGGNAWVGLWCGMSDTASWTVCDDDTSRPGAFVRLDGRTGELVPVDSAGALHVQTPQRPYGAAVDREGRVWFTTVYLSSLSAIDSNTGRVLGPFEDPSGDDCGSYGMTVQVKDAKTYVWLAPGYRRCRDTVVRYEVQAADGTGLFRHYAFTGDLGTEPFGYPRGIAIDELGLAWISADRDDVDVARLVALNPDTGLLQTFQSGLKVIDLGLLMSTHPSQAIGVGLATGADGGRQVWVAARSGHAAAVRRDTGEPLFSTTDLGELYTYSDFTGFVLRTFTAPRGRYRAIFEGCPPGNVTEWRELLWDAEVPAQSRLQLFAKAAGSAVALNDPAAPSVGPLEVSPASIAALAGPDRRYLQVEVIFTSLDQVSTPVLKSLQATFTCHGVLE